MKLLSPLLFSNVCLDCDGLACAISRMSLSLNAGRSSGLRLVVRFRSVTTSSSTQLPPALLISVRMDGHEVSFLFFTLRLPLESMGHGRSPPTGFPELKNSFTKATALGSIRSLSGSI